LCAVPPAQFPAITGVLSAVPATLITSAAARHKFQINGSVNYEDLYVRAAPNGGQRRESDGLTTTCDLWSAATKRTY
jgi:hypothetical protein